MNRRKVLLSSGVALSTALAGCGESDSSDRETGDPNGSDDSSNGGDDSGNGGDDSGNVNNTSESEENLVELLDHEWYEEEYNSGVRGQLENVSGETLDYVEVSVYFIDDEGVQFEESIDNTSDLAADRVWEFDAMFLGNDSSRVDTYEVETSADNY